MLNYYRDAIVDPKKYDSVPTSMMVAAPTTEEELESDLECPLCLKLFLEPVSIACGHTMCRSCLRAALRFHPQCPMCRAPCHYSAADLPLNCVIARLISKHLPRALNERKVETIEAEAEVAARYPIFVLESELLLPGMPVALFLYEPRYVELVRRSLKTSQRFCVVSLSRLIGVVVEIVEHFERLDGCFHIRAVAKERVTVMNCEPDEDMRSLLYATVTFIHDEPAEMPECQRLAEQLYAQVEPLVSELSPQHRMNLQAMCGHDIPKAPVPLRMYDETRRTQGSIDVSMWTDRYFSAVRTLIRKQHGFNNFWVSAALDNKALRLRTFEETSCRRRLELALDALHRPEPAKLRGSCGLRPSVYRGLVAVGLLILLISFLQS